MEQPVVAARSPLAVARSAVDLCEEALEKAPQMTIEERQAMIDKIQLALSESQKSLREITDAPPAPDVHSAGAPPAPEKRTHRHHCRWCFAPATSVCGLCRLIYYCSRECQCADWDTHKLLCIDSMSKRAMNHVELRIETWNLRELRAAVKDGRIDPRKGVRFVEKGTDSDLIPVCICPVIAIAITRAHIRMVKYFIAKGAVVNPPVPKVIPHDLSFSHNGASGIGFSTGCSYDIVDRVACRLVRVAITACARGITRERFAVYTSRVARCLRLAMKVSSNPKRDFIRLRYTISLFANVDFLAAILGCRPRLTAMIIETCNCKEYVESAYAKFAYLYAMDTYANVKISINDDESGEKLKMLSNDFPGSEQFAQLAVNRMITGVTNICFDYFKKPSELTSDAKAALDPEVSRLCASIAKSKKKPGKRR